jgi:hypothetical protein
MSNGVWQTLGPGSCVELPPATVRTFVNSNAQDVVRVTGWRPQGFEKFGMCVAG